MNFFSYDKKDEKAEYYEILNELMEHWENEIVEFKEAKGQYSEEKIGQYFSAISNEANLRQRQYGWLILGVSEEKEKHIVGTNFKEGNSQLFEQFKYDISCSLTDGITFQDIIELFPDEKRVLMFKIPAAVTGIPTEWKNRSFGRNGQSLLPLQQFKIDQIRMEEKLDWSKQLISGATIDDLDRDAIAFARIKYKERMNKVHINEEIDNLSDEDFLTKIKLLKDGKVSNAAMVLLGNSERDTFSEHPPIMMWRLINTSGEIRDYEIFSTPFIFVADKILKKIRNLTYRYMPNQQTLFPMETQQYDTWMLRELLNNCIAHSNYQLGGRIYINEFDDYITITNPGQFLPEKIEKVLQKTYNPPFYRNQLLADSMVKFNMIDTATSGIKKVYKIQRDKFFPLPDYDFSENNQIAVTVFGKTLNDNYMHILFDNPNLDIETVFLLDQIQKGNQSVLSKESIKHLRKYKLVEGRIGNLYLSASVAHSISAETNYIKNKSFDDKYYKDLMVEYLKKYKKAKKGDFKKLLYNKLPDVLSDTQKESKVRNLISSLKAHGVITKDSENKRKSSWILV